MLPSPVDRKLVERLIVAAADRLEGDWLLVGGALAVLWLESDRATEDIDLISLRGSQADRLALMDQAAQIGLPIEVVNSAADYFVRRIQGWDGMIEVLREGASARVFRPNPTLFLLLKLGRLSEADLEDCLLLLRRATEQGLAVDAGRIRAEAAALASTPDEELLQRRERLLAALDSAVER